ncbi:hypothetical protein OJF2_50700 [Aquisphaera giovannonii]|uniref:Uncharacterized protein n=1 Tax=Aquisphaera giovannonii TaxID=406548 RepID=A0A5B9W740_9BACT|nr:hypothetical protein [Aquisphaera giovannonii]QEH36486.1 hypothetical protein OJF2_50700 [Aquisphaera giovannonii]
MRLLSFLLALLFTAQAVAFPHGGSSAYTSTIPSPTKVWDWKAGVPAGVTFTRPSPESCFDSNGKLQTVGNDTPCIDYSGPAPNFCGTLFQKARTNYVLWNRDLTNPVWTATGMTVAKDQVGIDGASNSASSLTATAPNATIFQTLAVSGTNQRVTYYVRRITGTGAAQITGNGGTSYTNMSLSGVYGRFLVTATGTNPTIGIRLATAGDKIAVDAVQDEVGTDATSPILTTSSPVLRSAESASASTSGWFNSSAGTLEAEVMRSSTASDEVDFAASIDDGGALNNISVTTSTNLPGGRITKNGTAYNSAGMLPSYAANILAKVAVSYNSSGVSSAYSDSNQDLVSTQFNSIPATDISNAVVPTGMTTIRFGNSQDGTRSLNGCLQRVKYHTGNLTTSQKPATTYPDTAGTSVGTVTANLASTGVTIPIDYMGWSLETADLVNTSFYSGSNTSLQNLVSTWLGPNCYIRVGGNSQDTNPAPAITQTVIDNFRDFQNAACPGGGISWGLDGGVNDSSLAVTHAGYVLNDFPASKVDFAASNEPNIEMPGNISGWAAIFNSYYTALKAAYPSIKIEAAESDNLTLDTYIKATTAGISNLSMASFHSYLQGPSPKPKVSEILAQVGSVNWALNSSYGSKLALTETNMIYTGGAQGLSDRADAPIWILQNAIAQAPLGYKHLLQHNVLLAGDSTSYSHIGYYNFATQANCGGGWCPTPILYGMEEISKISGQQIVSNSISGLNANVQALCVKKPSGNARCIIINADQSNNALVYPDQSNPWTTANTYLTAGNGCTDNSVTMNGVAIGAGGSWAGSPVAISKGMPVSLSPCSFVSVDFQP